MARAVSLANLADFKVLKLPAARLTKVGLAKLHEVKGLLGLDLSNAILDSDGIPELGNLATLEWLSLSGTLLQDYEFHFLKHLPLLRKLDVSWTQFSDYSLGFLDSPLIDDLDLSGTHVTSDSFPRLLSYRALKHLRLERTPISIEELERFEPPVGLKVVF
jgi:hypothetical protein